MGEILVTQNGERQGAAENIPVQGADPGEIADYTAERAEAVKLQFVRDSLPDACEPCHEKQVEFIDSFVRFWPGRFNVRNVFEKLEGEKYACTHPGKLQWSGAGAGLPAES